MDLLSSIPPSFSDQLRRKTEELRFNIIVANRKTKFALNAPELADFRRAITDDIHEMDVDNLSKSFRTTVGFTTYDSYAPFLAVLSESPLKASAIVDLLAPGLPDCISKSSSTSGGHAKSFPKYNALSGVRSSAAEYRVIDPSQRRTTKAHLWYLGLNRMDILDDDHHPVATTYVTCGSVIRSRLGSSLDPEKDGGKMGAFILDHAAPFAAGFIRKWRSFLLIQSLFAIGSRSLESMSMAFFSTFVEMIRYLDTEFDLIVDCISRGTIPDLDGLADVRHYLEMNISPDPERAAELRRIGRPSFCPGWCARVWPGLRSVSGICSGSFASSIPLARWFLGQDTEIRASIFACTEGPIGKAHNPSLLCQFKLVEQNVFEFLDVQEGDSITALAQSWEVKLGRRYEVVMTTTDGLWRYRVGDVVEICGFDPTDGVPILRFIERRGVVIQTPDFMVTESDLRTAMLSVAPNTIVNWTVAIDESQLPRAIGFFVELANSQASDVALSPDDLFDALSRLNRNVAWAFGHGMLGKSTIWLLRDGTFSDFLQLKLDEGSNNVGQVKVPVVLPKMEYVAWFSERVVREL